MGDSERRSGIVLSERSERNIVANFIGVKGVINSITLKADTQDKVEKLAVESALSRNWAFTHDEVHVNVSGNAVTLSGTVNSINKKKEAGRIDWDAPGICELHNEFAVR